MTPLVKELLVKGLMAGTAVRTAKKTSLSVGYYAAAGAVGLIAIVFFAIAGYALLQESLSTPAAAAVTGIVLAVIATTIGVTGYYKIHAPAKKPAIATDGGFLDNVENTIKSLLSGFEEPVKDNPTLALLVAALAGFAAGDHLGDQRDGKYH